MKTVILICSSIFFSNFSYAQNVGIGISTPLHKLHVVNSAVSQNSIHAVNSGSTSGTSWDQANNFSGIHGQAASGSTQYQAGVYGYQLGNGINSGGVVGAYSSSTWGGLGYTDAIGGHWGVYTPSNIYAGANVGIGTMSPSTKLHVFHNSSVTSPLVLLYEAGTTDYSRLSFQNASGNTYWSIAGLNSITNANERLNFFNSTGGDIMSLTGNGRVGIGTTSPTFTLEVNSALSRTASFINTATSSDNFGVYGSCNNTAQFGTGVHGTGGNIGVEADASLIGAGYRQGVKAFGANGSTANYGVNAEAFGGANAYGIYGSALGFGINWAGYFAGDVLSTSGVYATSDRKFKNDIKPLRGGLSIINQLKPSVYTFKTDEFKQMNLPEGSQFGLIADEVQSILPNAVKKAVQPALYENHDEKNGKKLSEEVEFSAVNYTEMIPILIAAVQEQHTIITNLQKQIEKLKTELDNLKTNQK